MRVSDNPSVAKNSIPIRLSAGRLFMRLVCYSATCAVLSSVALAEAAELRIGSGFGIQYLPLYVMESQKLLEKQAERAGIRDLKVSYLRFSGGAALNDAILSGATDLAEGGVGPFAILWDKTRGNVKALTAMGDIPMVLLTNEPRIKSLQDLEDNDRIAVPAVKASMQAILLQMEAARIFGDKNYTNLDSKTVTLPHSEATAALLSKRGIISLHFSVAPFTARELADPSVRKITDSMQITGGPASLNVTFLTEKFYSDNPAICHAYIAALSEAMEIINRDKPLAAQIYIDGDKGAATDIKMVESILSDPSLNFTIVPHGVEYFTSFMHKIGTLKSKPTSWKDMFFPEGQNLPGN
jgi:NitT/TauT family transport system substrate-binding protein